MEEQKGKYTAARVLRFAIPSAIGIFLFMVPVPFNGSYNIPIAFITSKVTKLIAGAMPPIVYTVIFISAIGAVIAKITKPKILDSYPKIKTLFNPTLLWLIIRLLAAVIAFMLVIGKGPEFLIGSTTGKFVVDEFLKSFITTIFFAGTIMTLLLDFGFMEFIGVFLSKIFRKVFTLPGRAAIDCITSWMGDAVVAVLITSDQYEKGYYSGREAGVIATSFSAVSISFTLVILSQLDLSHMFFPFFYTTLAAGLLCAVIMPRIPPLSWKKDDYMQDIVGGKASDMDKTKGPLLAGALEQAILRADAADFSVVNFLKNGLFTLVSCGINTIPIVLFVGTVTLAFNEYTPLFTWLGYPFLPLLNLLQIPEAAAASSCMLAGFGDNFVPAVIASSSIQNEMTRFIVGSISINQLIYMSQVGALILGSKIPVNFKDLVLIFIERTILSLFIVTLIARFIVF